MIILGVDFHPEYEEIASVDTDTGEYQEKRLAHPKEAEEFYRSLSCVGQVVRWTWRPADTDGGLSGCWKGWEWSCGGEMPR
jgi:hypothetical protein